LSFRRTNADEASAARTRASAMVRTSPERSARGPTGGRSGLDDWRVAGERQAECAGWRLSVQLRSLFSCALRLGRRGMVPATRRLVQGTLEAWLSAAHRTGKAVPPPAVRLP
jgi:hypothetical protein